MIIESSKDILLIVLAFCALWLTLFVSWSFYYAAQILRQVSGLFNDFRHSLNLIDTVLKTVKNRLETSSSHLAFLAEGAREVVKYLQDKKTRKRPTTRKTK